MSLIPSESYSFPDHFTSTVIPSRKPKNAEPEPAPPEARRKKPSIVALPNPKPQPAPAAIRENPEPGRTQARAPAPKPVPVAKVPRPAQAPTVFENPRPVAASNPQADFFETFAQSGETALSKRRDKAKMRRFIVCESAAVTVLLPLVILGLSHRPDNVALVWVLNIFTIASAVVAALIPILFFALTPTLPEIER